MCAGARARALLDVCTGDGEGERHRGIHCWPDTDRAEGVNMNAARLAAATKNEAIPPRQLQPSDV